MFFAGRNGWWLRTTFFKNRSDTKFPSSESRRAFRLSDGPERPLTRLPSQFLAPHEQHHPTMTRSHNQQPKPKLTKEQRREKYTQLARDRKERAVARAVGRSQICFACRQKGHSLAFCPNSKNTPGKQRKLARKICYKCGSEEHALSACAKYVGPEDKDLPFATCFVCGEKGHLSSQCSQNEKGVFPNGGSCKRCGSNRHVSSKCPQTAESKPKKTTISEDDFDVNEYLEDMPNTAATSTKKTISEGASSKKRRVVNF